MSSPKKKAELIVDPGSPIAEQIAYLTVDLGARRLGVLMDEMKNQLDALQAQVDACCGGTLTLNKPADSSHSK